MVAVRPGGQYRELLGRPGVAGAFLASLVGRVPLGTTGLAVLLLVRESSGSYATAGMVTAGYALSLAAGIPIRARAADRTGAVRVLHRCAFWHPLALAGLLAMSRAELPTVALIGPAVLAGLTVPPVGAVMRALFGEIAAGPLLASAYAMESVAIELCFVTGPLLVAGLSAVSGPSAAVVASALLTAVGAVGLAASPALRAVRPHAGRENSLAGPLADRGVRALLFTIFCVGAGFGAVEVALPAFVERHDAPPAAAGVLLAVWSAASMAGGLAYGARPLPAPPHRQLPWLIAALAAAAALPLLARDPVTMAVALMGYGVTIAPYSACNSVLLSAAAPIGTVTEAFAWNTSMIFAGAAAGTVGAGLLIEAATPRTGLAITAGAALAALAATVVNRRWLPQNV